MCTRACIHIKGLFPSLLKYWSQGSQWDVRWENTHGWRAKILWKGAFKNSPLSSERTAWLDRQFYSLPDTENISRTIRICFNIFLHEQRKRHVYRVPFLQIQLTHTDGVSKLRLLTPLLRVNHYWLQHTGALHRKIQSLAQKTVVAVAPSSKDSDMRSTVFQKIRSLMQTAPLHKKKCKCKPWLSGEKDSQTHSNLILIKS